MSIRSDKKSHLQKLSLAFCKWRVLVKVNKKGRECTLQPLQTAKYSGNCLRRSTLLFFSPPGQTLGVCFLSPFKSSGLVRGVEIPRIVMCATDVGRKQTELAADRYLSFLWGGDLLSAQIIQLISVRFFSPGRCPSVITSHNTLLLLMMCTELVCVRKLHSLHILTRTFALFRFFPVCFQWCA